MKSLLTDIFIICLLGVVMSSFSVRTVSSVPTYSDPAILRTEPPEQEPSPEKIIVCIYIQPSDTKAEVSYEPQEITGDFDIFTPCGYSKEELSRALDDINHSEMLPYVDTLLNAEEKYGVNAFYLMCKLGLESGWCRYTSGENNIGGWTNGDGTYMDFASVDECIMHISEHLATDYEEITGPKLKDVCYRYCQNSNYTETILTIMEERQEVIERSNENGYTDFKM